MPPRGRRIRRFRTSLNGNLRGALPLFLGFLIAFLQLTAINVAESPSRAPAFTVGAFPSSALRSLNQLYPPFPAVPSAFRHFRRRIITASAGYAQPLHQIHLRQKSRTFTGR
ncbi:unnamed protein product [Closterium sp. Naga37s-1]|nr:unnamed protein product [Closterium sp. Naga37s-1]